MRIVWVAGLLVVALIVAGCDGGNDAETSGAPVDESAITEAVEAVMEENGVPGTAISIRTADGDWNGFYGEANIDEDAEWTADTRSAYRSITKSFVVTVLLQLADEGKVDLDSTLAEYVDGVPDGDKVTLRELAGMRSGIANYSSQPEFQQEFISDLEREWTAAELIAFAEPATPVFDPGSQYEYSNTNTLAIGEVIEAVTGKPWNEEVAERFPLETVTYPTVVDMPEPLAVGYSEGEDGEPEAVPLVSPSGFGAAGGLYGTVDDLRRWGEMLFDPDVVPESVQQERVADPSDPADDPASPEYDAYGLGIGELDGWWGHTGNGLGYQALVMHNPETGATVAIQMNATNANPDTPADLFRRIEPLVN